MSPRYLRFTAIGDHFLGYAGRSTRGSRPPPPSGEKEKKNQQMNGITTPETICTRWCISPQRYIKIHVHPRVIFT